MRAALEDDPGLGFLWAGLGTVILTLAVFHRLSRRRTHQMADQIPGPPGLPLIGNALDYIGPPHDVFKTLYWGHGQQYEGIFRMWVGPRLTVYISHPDDVKLILSSNEHIDKSPEYNFFQPWLGDGLLISTGELWRAHRKAIAPTFHLNVLKTFFPQFNRNSRDTVGRLREVKRELDCHDYMSEATVEILLETVMGVSKETQESRNGYAMAVMKMCDIIHQRHNKFFLRPEFLFNITSHKRIQDKLLSTIHSFTRKVLLIRKEAYVKNGNKVAGLAMPEADQGDQQESSMSFGMNKGVKDDIDQDIGEKKRLAFLDYLIDSSENGVILTEGQIQNQIDTIMFEGHDTTAAASSFFLCIMATRPDIQDKVYEELRSIFGDSDRAVTFQDTLEMKYLERCMMETLRLYPPVPIIARDLRKDLKLASRDLTLPGGCTVVIAPINLHRRPDIYPNPHHFDPDNFLPERTTGRHHYSFIPFSAGPRSCVGRKYAMLKLKVLLATVLRNFKAVGGKPEKEWKLQGDIILKRADGFGVKLIPRNN